MNSEIKKVYQLPSQENNENNNKKEKSTKS